MTRPLDRRARVLGPLILTTVHQAVGAPRIDGASVADAEGRRYGALVFGAGVRAPVVGWRDWTPPRVLWRGISETWPRPLPAIGRFLFGLRPERRSSARRRLRLRAAAHEVRCAECRVTWPSWAARVTGRSA